MQETPIYAHSLAGRRPATIFALIVTILMIVFAFAYKAPSYFFIPLVISLVIALSALIANPQTGVRLTAQTLHFYNGRHKPDVAVADIRSAKIESDMDGGPHADLVLANGEKAHIPAMCVNRDLGPALESLGIEVLRK
jgi:hypothetical protein